MEIGKDRPVSKNFGILTVLSAALSFVFLAGCSQQAAKEDVLVFAAASSNEAVTEVCQSYRLQENEALQVRTSFASSSTLATQILNGAGADLFLSANLQWVDKLQESGLVAKVERMVGNQLVVITRTGQSDWQPSQLKDLLDDRVRRIALADPASVPAGIYAKNAMTKLEIWQSIKPKTIYGTDVRQTLSHVENSAVDIGIVYRTDAKISSGVNIIFEIPIELTGSIDYGLVLTKRGQSRPQSQRLYDLFSTTGSKRIFEKHGFLVTGANE